MRCGSVTVVSRLRFGLVWNGAGSPVEVARRAEQVGYATLLFPDHTGMVAPIPAMAAAAAVTSVLRLGTQVINPAFRPLGALAHELAAVDIISGGRLEIGVGAGYAEREVTSLGLPFPRAGDRVRDVARILDVVPRLFAGETITEDTPTDGRGWGLLHEFRLEPTPPQGGSVPLMVGGNGDRLLATAARRADIVQLVGFTPRADGNDYRCFSDQGLRERIAHVRRAAGDRFTAIELSVLVQLAGIVPNPGEAVAALRSVSSGAMPAEQVLRSPFVQLGSSVDELCDGITALAERYGVTYITVFDGRSDGFDNVVSRLSS
jgi:probable F420-dependent oxidoreductase